MPEVPGGQAATGAAGPAEDRPAEDRVAGEPADHARPPRSPGWREVAAIAVLILLAVFAVELSSALLPPVREAFRGLPLTILVLVVGTVGLLVLIAARRPRT